MPSQLQQLGNRLHHLDAGKHAGLHGVHADVARRRCGTARELPRAATQAPWTPSEFARWTAVMTLIPCTPQASMVLRSAWMPAPPPESDPAIVRTRRGVELMSSTSGSSLKAEIVTTDALVRLAVDEDAGFAGDGADDDAARGRLYIGRERRYQGMVVATGKQPVGRIGVESVPNIAQRDRSGTARTDRYRSPRWPRQCVRDPGRARRSRRTWQWLQRLRAPGRSVRRIGPAAGLDKHPRRAEPARQHGETRRCPADAAGQDHAVTGTSAGAGHGRMAWRSPNDEMPRTTTVGARYVTASNRCGRR